MSQFLPEKPEKALEYGIENLERCFVGVPENVIKIAHMCCGYPNALDSENYLKGLTFCLF
ncbi:MAG: hypothetical protein CM1200mP30_31910 [Pseudomonadota bacterium]|nr:MAG: hypothetical protein CM1200mP30_31910 [Pseudomonadota bacterium]